MNLLKNTILAACILAMTVSVFGCSEEGTMEKAGKKVDQAAEEAADAAKKLFD